MNLCLQFRIQGFKQLWTRTHFLSHLNRCTKLCAAALSQVASIKPNSHTTDVERVECIMLKNLLAGNKQDIKKLTSKNSYPNHQSQNTALNTQTNSNHHKEHLLVWEDTLLSPQHVLKIDGRVKVPGSKGTLVDLKTIDSETWYCNEIVIDKNAKNIFDIKECCLQFSVKNTVNTETQKYPFVEKRKSTCGPSPEQLSLVLLRLREELPHFFEGHHRYSIYREDVLFVNKLTRTKTRSLKAYKFIMKSMQFAGKLFWSQVSFEVIRITKHAEDNTIRLRWTAKGIPWYQVPFFVLTGKPQSSLFYRYIDGFSIFEVGRDGLVHCHRLDKVIPTSNPERHKWSIRMQILTLLGLAEIGNRGPCESFQVKSQEMLKKI